MPHHHATTRTRLTTATASVIAALCFAATDPHAPVPQAKVDSIEFETTCRLPVYKPRPEHEPVRRFVEPKLKTVPEGMLVVGALALGAEQFGLTDTQAAELNQALVDTYQHIGNDPAFAGVPTALDRRLSQDAQRPGHYLLYRPAELRDPHPTLVFLHGFGGNFQFYTWALKTAFPDHVILTPSWASAGTRARRSTSTRCAPTPSDA